ncbi:ABC transporter [Volvox carteri f. nagariensis]|uniref:ABC transporter n=1 Tax=Volvox carteri f. nagariensis TaxID=3068 RepID=D8TK25_VOLCA|nr:ABC transporter [Volvox carteri f. nagariensis]EFJ52174.1 ABC transporter [Volvox carteri f. nagariensis]|eukprot:XP_002946948.1 ABC transporter [Volvox carteri f. nagariensis]
MDEDAYAATLQACALVTDLELLPAGDASEIGEKGINLSGGQKHRVALARATYAAADIYLLDDPLSAVDAHVGRHLFEECICGLLEDRTRVLVTHQLQYLPSADLVVVMAGGAVQHVSTCGGRGGWGRVVAGGGGREDSGGAEIGGGEIVCVCVYMYMFRVLVVKVSTNTSSFPPSGPLAPAPPPQVEERAKGRVERSVYAAYLLAWSVAYLLPVAVVCFALGERGLQVLQNFVLSSWSNATAEAEEEHKRAHNGKYLSLYFILGLSSIGVQLLRSFLLILGSIRASRLLAKKLLDKVVRLPMSFFDQQPTGRLLNRFTKDTEALDINVSGAVNSALSTFVTAMLSVVVVVVVTPLAVVCFLPLSFVYYRVQQLYIASSRELKRLDSLAFSPIFQHFGETLTGLTTIRAFRKMDQFMDKNRANLNHSNRAYWPIQVVNRWLSVRLELMGAFVVFTAAVTVAVIFPRNAGLAGLAITSALNLTGIMNWMVRQTTELEVNMNSVERMVEYNRYDEEAPAVIESNRPPKNWPTEGAISVKDLYVRYRAELDPVLRGLSFEISGREKVGVCGRTGCGKSTLMMTLYRLVEPSSGTIKIDGYDITAMGLYDLRSRLSLVPQDPVIFSGSVRSNLDPFGQFKSRGDGEMWEALKRAGLDETVRAYDKGLDAEVKEGGANLSVGQRQLLCMARALLRASKILVLDEATSNVDNSTDSLIQRTIRTAFKDCTVLTIAHRLHTIVDSDRILLLEGGQLGEFGSPAQLLRNPQSHFRSLVEETMRGGGAAADVVAQVYKSATDGE